MKKCDGSGQWWASTRRMTLVAMPAILAACASGGAPAPTAAPPPMIPDPAAPPAEANVPMGRPASAPEVTLDTVRAGQFDNGKMWTFEYPPTDYLRETYQFVPDAAWLERARLGALRIPSCSASFVSPNGLVMTNHHCARESVSQVSEEGENLLDNGFYARSLSEERAVSDLYADQLIEIVDVSAEVEDALPAGLDDAAHGEALDSITEGIAERLAAERGGEEAGIEVEVISLWNGARYSAYIFRRYDDVRLVMAPELQVAFFGGDPDNFTYPRYDLDMAFYRVYGDDGEPLESHHHFPFDTSGVSNGDLIFIVGNPGSTSRLQTVAELDYRRTLGDRALLDFITSRIETLQGYATRNPQVAERLDLRNKIFSLLNSQKAYTGMLEGLHDPVLMARRWDAERSFREAVNREPVLRPLYESLFDRMADIQREKADLAADVRAFAGLGAPDYSAAVLLRAFYGLQYLGVRAQGGDEELLDDLEESFLSVAEQPAELQTLLLARRFQDLVDAYGDTSSVVRSLLGGTPTPRAAAARVVSESALADSARAAAALRNGSLGPTDPALRMIQDMLPRFIPFQQRFSALADRERAVANALGRARFAVYGTSIPPDATFSLRLADGVVRGYEYNGTEAPALTTFYGLYNRHYGFKGRDEWRLPARWLDPPDTFDLGTPINFVSTADIIGGNSGSPVVNTRLEVVGLVFDGNIESLPGDFIYVPDKNRSVAVDVRGILEALDDIYDADRLVLELTTGALVPTEEAADRGRGGGE